MKQMCRTVWEPKPEGEAIAPSPGRACALYHCPRCGNIMRPTPLTAREVEMLREYALGLSTLEIAEKKFVDHKTVEAHRRRIIVKMGVSNMTAAVVLGIKQGVILL